MVKALEGERKAWKLDSVSNRIPETEERASKLKRPLLALVLLGAVVVIWTCVSLSSLRSPYAKMLSLCVKSVESGGYFNSTESAAICQQSVGKYGLSHAVPYLSTLWSWYSPSAVLATLETIPNLQMEEGLAVVAVLAFLFSTLRLPAFLRRPLRLPKALRVVALLVSLALAALYIFAAMLDSIGINSWFHLQNFSWWALNTFFMSYDFFGPISFICFVGAIIGFTVYGLHKGVLRAFWDSIRFFAVPALLFLEASLLWCDGGEMAIHATSFTTWHIHVHGDTFYLVSNYFVLSMAVSLAFVAFALPLVRKGLFPHNAQTISS